MLLLQSCLFALLAALLVGASPNPASPTPQNLLGEVIDALGIGLVTHIDVTLTVRFLLPHSLSAATTVSSARHPDQQPRNRRFRRLTLLPFRPQFSPTHNTTAQNPLAFELTIDSVSTTGGLNGTVYTSFEHRFARPVVVPPFGQANSGNITNVLLTQGATASLAIIPFGVLDLINVDVNVRALSIFGIGGVPLVISGLHQASVPTAYNLDLS
ncbi:hypothetical protein B0H14DRAFT_32557 [Mycena olivaceomarginata]|nr:hypothetical protein B0H14DRAFT_32557 [Mycena olivaceomarginata]